MPNNAESQFCDTCIKQFTGIRRDPTESGHNRITTIYLTFLTTLPDTVWTSGAVALASVVSVRYIQYSVGDSYSDRARPSRRRTFQSIINKQLKNQLTRFASESYDRLNVHRIYWMKAGCDTKNHENAVKTICIVYSIKRIPSVMHCLTFLKQRVVCE